jgi:transglutaminase-like putative cysteine protease
MTARELRARAWAAAACGLAQVAATAAQMVPWWALPFTLALTALVSRPPGPINPARSRLTRSAGVACVAAFAALIAFRSVTAGGVGADPVSSLRSLTEALVVLSLIMAPSATTPREHRVWLTVTTGVLVAAAAGGRSPASAALTAGSWVILLVAIAKVQVTAAHAGGAVPAVVIGPPKPPRALASLRGSESAVPVLAALIAGTLVFYALPSGLGGGGLARRIVRHVDGGSSAAAPETRANVGVDTFGAGDLSLLVRGALPDTPIMRVPLRSPPLWRGTIYRAYTGWSWQDGINDHFVALTGPTAAVPVTSDDPPPAGRQETDRVQVTPGAGASLVWAPGVITRLSGPADELFHVIRGGNNVRAFGRYAHALTSYTVTSTVATTRPATLRAARGPDPVNSIWTQLPGGLPPEIARLARQITARAADRLGQVDDIEAYLRSHETYSQNSPVPSPGDDAVADFLFRDHVGFCEQFASAEAVLLRTLGVPARVVSGLAYGIRSGPTRMYTAANAHAWVEVYYPGIGWSPTDPTVGVPLAPPPTSHRSLFGRVVSAVTAAVPGGRLALAVLLALVLMVCGALVRLARGGRASSPRRRGSNPSGPVLAAFLRLSEDPRGVAPRTRPETAREYLARLDLPRQTEPALAALEQEMYGASPPEPRAAREAVAAFDALHRERATGVTPSQER